MENLGPIFAWLLVGCGLFGRNAENRNVWQSNLALRIGNESNDGMMKEWDDRVME